ncbi:MULTISPECIES: DUF5324 family protein [unclassified Kitasatospora]|uniref:DUF5324 family protein n=1 Tax=unclassified Kitasatospora TaxID=2633591 RepID=UPI00070CD061|nr:MULTISPECIES: DUF5324 family protein [unclassified Kitasatospora]KQV22216.1 hypothetical protein ASC99_17855 [Kitasatospora sp. Root107]KRB64613.1 hypothetical protein ASE03_32900 [Kitasatospora sp. Root187]
MISNQVEMCIQDAIEEEKLVTRLDSARDTADKARDTLAPYAATAKETAQHYAAVMDEARNRLGPKVHAAGSQAKAGAGQAAQAARVQYVKHLAPQLEHAFGSLPPHAQQSTLKAVHRAQEAALAAKLSATRAADQARVTVLPRVTEAVEQARAGITPVAQEAQLRGAAAFTALQGNVSAAEISELAARNVRKRQRHGWATGLAVTGALAIATGLIAWQWWHSRSNPQWLIEPPTEDGPESQLNGSGPAGTGATAASTPSPSADPEDPTHEDRPKPHDPRKPH